MLLSAVQVMSVLISAYISVYMCNDRTFCVIILEGYGVAEMYIVVLGDTDRMFGCLGDRVMCLPPRRELVSLSRAL